MRTRDATPILLVLVFIGSMLISLRESSAASVPDSAGVASLKAIFEKAESGTMMRILRTDSTLVEGSLISTRGVELLDPETGDREIVDLERVDTLWEMRFSKARGEAIGGTFGLLVGVLAGVTLGLGFHEYGCTYGECGESSAAPAAVTGAFLGALVGGCTGLVIGNVASTGEQEWILRYPLEDKTRGH